MTNRLPYETTAGNLSAEITYKQLIEYCILIQEDCHKLGNDCALRGHSLAAANWHTIANNFDKVATVITHLAKGKTSSSIGFRA